MGVSSKVEAWKFTWPMKRYQRHIANVSKTLVIIITVMQTERQWSCCKFLLVTQETNAVKK